MNKNKNTGSVLLVCMILLAVMSIIGVVAMQSASFQEKFSRNIFYSVQSFQSAVNEQGQQYNTASEDEDMLLEAVVAATAEKTLDKQLEVEHAAMQSTLIYSGEGLPPAGYSLGKYRGLRFSINTKSTYENIDAISDQTLGFQYAAPKNI